MSSERSHGVMIQICRSGDRVRSGDMPGALVQKGCVTLIKTSFISSHTTLLYQCSRHISRSRPISRSTDLYRYTRCRVGDARPTPPLPSRSPSPPPRTDPNLALVHPRTVTRLPRHAPSTLWPHSTTCPVSLFFCPQC
jgi:hypothetical protein